MSPLIKKVGNLNQERADFLLAPIPATQGFSAFLLIISERGDAEHQMPLASRYLR